MTTQRRGDVLRHLYRAALRGPSVLLTDAELLALFVRGPRTPDGEAAFEALVVRHGPTVWGVCRRVLRNDADAEDAFQATFLVFVRKAAGLLDRDAVGSWLYGVAQNTALKARALSNQRRRKEGEAAPPTASTDSDDRREMIGLLNDELRRLPEMYREAIRLCDLEGVPLKTAAQKLGCPQGTVAGRLTRGRALLTRRLARFGLSLSGAALIAALSESATAAVPSSLVQATVEAAAAWSAGETVFPAVSDLAQEMLRTMTLTRFKAVTCLLLALGLIGVALDLFRPGAADPKAAAAPPLQSRQEKPKPDKPKTDKERLLGSWKLVALVLDGNNVPAENLDHYVYFTEDNFYFRQAGKLDKPARWEIDATKDPKTIDFKLSDRKDEVALGLYRLKDDQLEICLPSGKLGERPTELASKPGTSQRLMSFRRDPDAPKLDVEKPKADKPKPDQTKKDKPLLLGAWKIVAAVAKGTDVPEKELKDSYLYFTEDALYFAKNGEFDGPGSWEIDETKDPKTIDIKPGDKPEVALGLYHLKDDELQLCFPAGENEDRPTELASKPDTQLMLMTLRRDPNAPKLDVEKAKENKKVRELREASALRLRKIYGALFKYDDAKGTLPPAAIVKDGKPLLSWRVAILPYLDEEALFNEFKLDEPWDSEHNKKLLEKMPAAFGTEGTATFYRVFTGPGTLFEGETGVKLSDIPDGTERTILLVEAGQAVPWTKPDELPYLADKPLPKFGGLLKEGFHIMTANSATMLVRGKFNEAILRSMILRNDGKSEGLDDLIKE